MKVADLQKVLRSLAEVISTKAPARELTDAANALTPFAHYKVEAFGEFLARVEAKYGATGELPDGKPPKPPPVPKVPRTPKAPKAPKPPPPTVQSLLAAVEDLKARLRHDPTLNKGGVEAELKKFEKPMGKPDLIAAVKRLGLQATPKNKGDAIAMLVTYTVAAQGGLERSNA